MEEERADLSGAHLTCVVSPNVTRKPSHLNHASPLHPPIVTVDRTVTPTAHIVSVIELGRASMALLLGVGSSTATNNHHRTCRTELGDAVHIGTTTDQRGRSSLPTRARKHVRTTNSNPMGTTLNHDQQCHQLARPFLILQVHVNCHLPMTRRRQ